MNEYRVEFRDGAAAGYPANSLEQAHKIAKEYGDSPYILYKKTEIPKGWLRVGTNNVV